MLGRTNKGVNAYMIIEPDTNEKFVDSSGRTWVSDAWLRKQTTTHSTDGWHEAVVERIKGSLSTRKGSQRLVKGQVWYQIKNVLEAFDQVRNF